MKSNGEYSLDRIVEAHTYVQQEHKRGHVVINVTPAGVGCERA